VSAVRWGIVGNVLAAWVFTFPAAGLVAAAMFALTLLPAGPVVVFGIAVLFSAGMFIAVRRRAYATPRVAAPELAPTAPPPP
jgi:PiT family inorganic phosphate transporter